ncbi:MAG TPA: PA14 domain-containing protein, partial [Pyrinomonadaceae bacterium]
LTLAASSSYGLGSPVSASASIADNDTHAPTTNIISPAFGATYTSPASIVINATASDSDGQITKVEFFQGSTRLGEDTAAPYSLTWTNVAAGSYTLTAKATDNAGATGTSVPVNVFVNQPPTANAGGPYSGTSGNAIQFNAGGSTDTDGTIASYVWNFGDGTNGSGATPTHAYASYGAYTATLTVTDDRGAQSSAATTVNISTPSGNGSGLRGRYFDQIDFNDFKMSRVDATLNFDWGSGAPHASMGSETFAVQWTGQVVPRYSETYTFYTHSDDGVKLWVNQQLLIDNWMDHAFTENSGQITLVAGRQYDIRVEYFENYGGAVAKLLWSSPSQPKELIPQSQLYACWKSSEQFVGDFYQGVLVRQPDASELQHWKQRLMQAQGGARLLEEARELGRALFRSAEYTSRNRDNRQYIGDLYRGYLQRDPAEDQAGWDYWTNQLDADPAGGRANALRAFEQSGEFAEKVDKLCDTSASSSGYNFSAARIEPSNRTGAPGADLRSGNYQWSLPLLNLPGRSGLDLGLSLSYNSLVWTRDGSGTAISFDADRGFPSPGFRLGFPLIQSRFYNPLTGRYAYLLVTPSGQRVELRQLAGSVNTYESADSTYMQLTDNGEGSLSLRMPDGAQLNYWQMGGDYLCTEIKDRNGNFITIRYDGYGQLQSVTDTLARTLNFRYDAYQNLVSIWQTWTVNGQQQEHVYASFGYADRAINTNFPNMTVIGPHNGEVLPLLTQVGLDDGSYYKFDYTSWGQVSKITHYAADSNPQQDNHPLNYVSYNLPQNNGAAHSDCPRFTERRDWA